MLNKSRWPREAIASRFGIPWAGNKSVEFLHHGVNRLIVDLFLPTSRDPQGIHKAIWDEIEEMPFDFQPGEPMTLAADVV